MKSVFLFIVVFATGHPAFVPSRYPGYRSDLFVCPNPQSDRVEIDRLTVDANGKKLKAFYLGLNVENLWIAGSHINWETGEADKPDAHSGNHTHCSAFVAAACKQLGIYILRPPEHGQILLANGQYEWLQTDAARKSGWSSITGVNRLSVYTQVQRLANSGKVAVAVIRSADRSRPGHAALVMPKETDTPTLEESGPVVIMAGTHNFNFISLRNGFKSHISGWPEKDILFFVNTRDQYANDH